MTPIFKVLSILLTYPTEEMQAATSELRRAISAERALDADHRIRLTALIDDIETGDLMDTQERYVFLFDRTRSLSLHLFEHIHGESRDRGQAMVDLADHYASHGLELSAKELPDFLPLFLEFLGTRPLPEARELLEQPLHVIAALGERLRKRKSAYAWVMLTLEGIAKGKPAKAALDDLLAEPEEDPDDLEALDRTWEDQPVMFGPGSTGTAPGGGCPAVRDTLARMDRPADTKPH